MLERSRAYGRIGGEKIGDDLDLQGESHIIGRVGGSIIGFNCDLNVNAEKTKIEGRLGGSFIGADVDFNIEGDFSPIIAAVLAVTAYKIYIDKAASGASGGS